MRRRCQWVFERDHEGTGPPAIVYQVRLAVRSEKDSSKQTALNRDAGETCLTDGVGTLGTIFIEYGGTLGASGT